MKKYIKCLGIIILLIILFKIDFDILLQTLYQTNVFYLLIAIMLNIPQLFLKSYRWNRLLYEQNIKYLPIQSFLIYMSSLYIGFITPGRLGEFVKALYLKSDKGLSISRGITSVFIDRLFDMYLLIILGVVGVWKFNIMKEMSNISLIVIIVIILVPIVMLNKRFMKKILSLLYNLIVINRVKDRIEERFEDFYGGINQLINFKLVFPAFLTCLSYLVFFVQCYIIVFAMGISINFITIVLFMSISNLISFMPISISGLGTRDATLIYLFSLIGLTPELAVSYSFLVLVTFFIAGGLMGFIAWWFRPLSLKFI